MRLELKARGTERTAAMAAVSIDAAVGARPPSATHLAAPQCAISRLTSPCTAALSLVFTSTLHPIFSVRITTDYYKCTPIQVSNWLVLWSGTRLARDFDHGSIISTNIWFVPTRLHQNWRLQIRQSTKTNKYAHKDLSTAAWSAKFSISACISVCP